MDCIFTHTVAFLVGFISAYVLFVPNRPRPAGYLDVSPVMHQLYCQVAELNARLRKLLETEAKDLAAKEEGANHDE